MMDEVPVLGLLNKNKLKSLNFASNLCSIFKSDFDQPAKSSSAEPSSSKALKRQRNLLDSSSDESGDDSGGGKDGSSRQASKKARDEVVENKENSVKAATASQATLASKKTTEIKKYVTESQVADKQKSSQSQQGSFGGGGGGGDKMNPFGGGGGGNFKGSFVKKKSYSNDNFRRLNMKSFRHKGKGNGACGRFSKGAKHKRMMWKNNKNKNKCNNRPTNDDDDNRVNQNLIYDANMYQSDDEPPPVEKDSAIDPTSDQAQFEKICKSVGNGAPKLKRSIIEPNAASKKPAKPKKSPAKTKTAKPKKPPRASKKQPEDPKEPDEEDEVEKTQKKKSVKKRAEPKKPRVTKKQKEELERVEEEAEAEAHEEEEEEEEKEKDEATVVTPKATEGPKAKAKKKLDDESLHDELKQINHADLDDSDDQDSDEPMPMVTNGGQMRILELDAEGNFPRLPKYAFQMLESVFGHKSFKPHQEDAIVKIACGLSTLVILSTGHGKSLIYQMAAKMYAKKYPGSVVLVISPLISLMQDQLANLSRGLKAAMCDSQMSYNEFQKMLEDLNDGKINILYMSPEALISKKIRSIPRLAFVCIDEVHCLSQWSHNFRPSYLQLCQTLIDFYKVKCILGLTATATERTIEEIQSYFDIDKRNIIKDCDLPKNLVISVSKDYNKDKALVNLFKSESFKEYCDHVIIYCSRREQTEKLAQFLRSTLASEFESRCEKMSFEDKIKQFKLKKKATDEMSEFNIAEAYHAGLSANQRKRIQTQFVKGKLKIIVATMAFGMGIDMPNIRVVIHYNMPKSIENYVQEVGRAGRDSKLSHCHLFLETQREDVNEIKRYVHMNGYDQLTIKKLVLKLFSVCSPDTCSHYHQSSDEPQHAQYVHHSAMNILDLVDYLDIKEETIMTLLCYLQTQNYLVMMPNCMRKCLLQSYKGVDYICDLAKTDALLKTMISQGSPTGHLNSPEICVDLIDLCESMGMEYEVMLRKVKNLQWSIDSEGNYRAKSGISVQFQDTCFYVKRKCLKTDEDIDMVIDFLWTRVHKQMTDAYLNFKTLYKILSDSSFRSVDEFAYHLRAKKASDQQEEPAETPTTDAEMREQDCLTTTTASEQPPTEENSILTKSNQLKAMLNDYFSGRFNEQEFIGDYRLDHESTNPDHKYGLNDGELKRLIQDIKKFIYTYSSDMKLTGQVVARIFHGISSPKYPAEVWGRARVFWRSHLDVDFEDLVKLATDELIKF